MSRKIGQTGQAGSDTTDGCIMKATTEHVAELKRIAGTALTNLPEPDYFARALAERDIYFVPGQAYIMLNWNPAYDPFRKKGIAEIQDLYVSPGHRRQGLGRRLISYCEDQARLAGRSEIGIGVALHAAFGAAQRLYVLCGYIPDGAGVTYDRSSLQAYSFRPVDDNMCLMLIKPL